MAASPELPKGGLKGLQVPEMQTWPEPIPCSRVSFNLLQGFYAFLYFFFVWISISCFFHLEFAIYRTEAFQLETPKSCATITDPLVL